MGASPLPSPFRLPLRGGGPRHRPLRRLEPVVPMINVVFLLLIFFLMSATLTPPDPVETRLPEAEGAGPSGAGGQALYLGRDGIAAFGMARGDDAIGAAVAARAGDGVDAEPLQLRADEAAQAPALVALLRALAEAGVENVALVTVPPRDGGGTP